MAAAKDINEQQQTAMALRQSRIAALGDLLRSKGFFWLATSHVLMGGWSQAGNMITLEAEGPWLCECPEMWEGTPSEEMILKDMCHKNGDKRLHGDRRQELVFIGEKLVHETLQGILDQCLLTDDEMMLSPEEWKESMNEQDLIKLSIPEEMEDPEEGVIDQQ